MQICVCFATRTTFDLIFSMDRGGFKCHPHNAATNRPVIRRFLPIKQGQNMRTGCNCCFLKKKTLTCMFTSAKNRMHASAEPICAISLISHGFSSSFPPFLRIPWGSRIAGEAITSRLHTWDPSFNLFIAIYHFPPQISVIICIIHMTLKDTV